MADGPHKYHVVGSVGGGGGVVTDLQSVFGVSRGRRVKIFAYGFLFAFVAATAFLAFNPSVATSSPWFDRFFSASSSTSASSSVRSQFSNLISSIFPASHPSVTANAARPSGATDKGVVSGSRATNFTASLGRKNATIGASEAARNGTEQERSPAESKTAPAKNATKIESSDQKVPTSSKNQTFAQNPKNQTMSLEKQPSSVAGDRRNKSKTVDLKPKNGTFASNPTAKKVGADQPARQYSLESMKKCDLFDGKWVKDDSYPLYKEGSCPHIDQPFDCFLNGRPDQDFQKLRWQPKGCNIPRLNGTDMLERLRGRRLVFVGDSLNRNMWESLVCTLSNSVKDKSKVFEASGKREFRTEGSYSFVFEDYNCSVEFFRSPFLVQEWESPEPNGTTKETLRLDLIEKKSDRYKKADVIVFNTGHWWTHEKTSLGKDYYQEGSRVYGQLNVVEAFHKALATWAKWVDSKVDPHKTLVFFRGYSSSHFSGGRWNSGGSCDKETQPITNEAYLAKYPQKMKVLETVLKEMKTSVSYLNITRMTDYRKDAHPSVYRKRNLTVEERTSPLRYQDCSHWCLPGVPDSWNELLYAEMLIKLH